jgi:hypothetical protein
MRNQEFIDSLFGNACPQGESTDLIKKFHITTHCVDWDVVAHKDDEGHWVVVDFHTSKEV